MLAEIPALPQDLRCSWPDSAYNPVMAITSINYSWQSSPRSPLPDIYAGTRS